MRQLFHLLYPRKKKKSQTPNSVKNVNILMVPDAHRFSFTFALYLFFFNFICDIPLFVIRRNSSLIKKYFPLILILFNEHGIWWKIYCRRTCNNSHLNESGKDANIYRIHIWKDSDVMNWTLKKCKWEWEWSQSNVLSKECMT